MLVLERYFDPDPWEKFYMENFLKAISKESVARQFRRENLAMTLQTLVSLKQEAPWLFKQIP